MAERGKDAGRWPSSEDANYAFLGAGSLHPLDLAYSAGFMLVIVALGAIVFNRVEATFIDVV